MFTCTTKVSNGKSILTVHGKNLSSESVSKLFGEGVDVVGGISAEDIRTVRDIFDIVDVLPEASTLL